MESKIAAADWLRKNQKELKGVPATEVAIRLRADTSIDAAPSSIRVIAKAAGVGIGRGGSTSGLAQDGFTRDAFLAKLLRRLYDEIGAELSEEERDGLTLIVSRRNPTQK